ncbi:MAG: RNA 2',3'-cyclic phosphodiesterase [Methanothrix sp.]
MEIPDNTSGFITEVLRDAAAKYGIKLIPMQNMHITLEFLGEISDEKALEVSDILASFNAKKFIAELGKISTFGSRSSVAFMSMSKGEAEAIRIHGVLHHKLSALRGIKLEERAFFPHISIARGSPRNLNAFADGVSAKWGGSDPFTISSLTFKKSVLGGTNARYETIFGKVLS